MFWKLVIQLPIHLLLFLMPDSWRPEVERPLILSALSIIRFRQLRKFASLRWLFWGRPTRMAHEGFKYSNISWVLQWTNILKTGNWIAKSSPPLFAARLRATGSRETTFLEPHFDRRRRNSLLFSSSDFTPSLRSLPTTHPDSRQPCKCELVNH